MALIINQIARFSVPGGGLRGEVQKNFVLSPDASKPTAGYVLAATALGLATIDHAVVLTPSLSYDARLFMATDGASGTLQWFARGGAAATDVNVALTASVTGVSTAPVYLQVIGR